MIEVVTKIFITALIAFSGAFSVAQSMEKERADVPEPAAVSVHGVRYQAPPFMRLKGLPHNGGYVEAIDELSGRRLWVVRVVERKTNDGKEQDKQDIYIAQIRLEAGGRHLFIVDERGRQHRLDLRTRRVEHMPAPGAASK
jgi:hypothetical protein